MNNEQRKKEIEDRVDELTQNQLTLKKLTSEQLDAFSQFLDKKPMLGDLTSDLSLGYKTVEMALEHIKTHPQIMDKIAGLIVEQNSEDPRLLQDVASKLMEAANNTKDEATRLAIDTVLKDKLADYLVSDDRDEVTYNVGKAAGKDHHELIALIYYANKDKHSIDFSEQYGKTITPLIKAALELNKPEMLTQVIQDIAKQHPEGINPAMDVIAMAKPDQLNMAISAILEDDKISTHGETLANKILSSDKTIASLSQDNINKLAKFYTPTTASSKFLHVLVEKNYTKDITAQNLSNKIKVGLESYVLNDRSGFDQAIEAYVETKRYHEKKPIMTRIKALFSGQKLEDYKNNAVAVQIDGIRTAISTNIDIEAFKAKNPDLTDEALNERVEGKIKTAEQESSARIAKVDSAQAQAQGPISTLEKIFGATEGTKSRSNSVASTRTRSISSEGRGKS